MLSSKALFTGTQVAYFVICPTKLWLFSHHTTMEHESELVAMGKLLNEESFSASEKDVIIDNKIAIDFIKTRSGIVLHEIKKSAKLEKAHKMQLLYYMYYLKKYKGIENVKGVIHYPTKRKTLELELDSKAEQELKRILKEIQRIVKMEKPPKTERKKYCRKCSYFEFCWC